MGWNTPRTWSFDEIPTEGMMNTHIRDNFNALRELAYAQIVSPVTVTATAEASATTIVTAPAVTCDGTNSIMIEFFCPITSAAGNVMDVVIHLFQDGSSIGYMGQQGLASVAGGCTVYLLRKITPAAGSRTFSVRAWKSGSGNPVFNAGLGLAPGQYAPTFIRLRA